MNGDALKFTMYFGERDRAEHGLLADQLHDLYGRHRLQTSVLLRGTSGFGRSHHLHTDKLLTLSEDLPVVSVAVDTRERIESMLELVLQMKPRGLITLERARLFSGEIEPQEPAERPARPAGKLASAPSEATDRTAWATKLTVYLGRQERALGGPAFVAVCELLRLRGIAGATAMLGVDGTARGRRRRARFLARNAEVPMMIIAVGPAERIARVMPELGGLLREPLLTLERVRVCKLDGELLARPRELPEVDEHGRAMWQKLMVYSSHAATHEGDALHLELIRRLRESKASGATSLAGIWGFHGDHPPHGDRFFQARRHVPIVTIIIDNCEQIARSFEIVDQLTSEAGLVTSEMIPAMSAVSEGAGRTALRLADHSS